MNNYKMLKVWSESHSLTLRIYKVTSSYPKSELYGLNSQIRRASMSMPCNMAEGSSRDSDRDFQRFLEIAGGSGLELEYQQLLSYDLGYIDKSTYDELNASIVIILKQLFFLRRSLKETFYHPTIRRRNSSGGRNPITLVSGSSKPSEPKKRIVGTPTTSNCCRRASDSGESKFVRSTLNRT